MSEYNREKIIEKFTKARRGDVAFFPCIDSTNTYLRDLSVKGGASSGDVVIADTQTGGRGRLGKSFISPSNTGIYMSYLFSAENCSFQEISELTAWCAVCVREAILECCQFEVKIKWVNDLVYGRKKLCGILTEMATMQNNCNQKNVIIGIGVNVNNSSADFSEELSKIATSIKCITGKMFDRSVLCAKIIENLDKLQEDFPKMRTEYLLKYRENCAIIGEKVILERDSQKNGEKYSRTGIVKGISDNFGLVVDFSGTGLETVTDGDVSVKGFYGVE